MAPKHRQCCAKAEMRDQRGVRQPPHADTPNQPGVGECGQRDRAADAAEGEWEQLAEAIAGGKDLLRTRDVRTRTASATG
jgi:hypothetical protein